MSSIKISSLNCQGLGNYQKRRDVFQFLRQKQYNIYCIQDTHFDHKMYRQVRAEWGYECILAPNNTRSRGVAVLFNNNFDFKIKKTIIDNAGNFIVLLMHTMGKDMVLVNIYGPNRDDPTFFEEIKHRIQDLGNQNIIIVGDWNLVLNPSLDYYNYRNINNAKAQEAVIEMINDLELVDVWRELNPEVLRYSWRRPNPFQQSRLDFFLISDNLIANVKDADIQYGYRSDHSLVDLHLAFGSEERHKNFWKFNSSLLKDSKYANMVNETIENITEQYAALPYDRERLSKIPKEEIHFSISDQLFLDVLLMEIRSRTISYGINKKREDTNRERKLELEIQALEKKNPLGEEEMKLIHEKQEEMNNIRKMKMDGIITRSKARWILQGEKINKYFCNLEKRHFVSKQMLKLVSNEGKTLTTNEEMLQETKKFYETLYSERKCEDAKIETYIRSLPKLSVKESKDLEGPITLEEATVALKHMQNEKSPGTDGMTVSFFKFFWKKLGAFVVRSLNEGFNNEEMSITQKEGIIICLPKGDKPREYLKNWRPISLLNVTYKIGSTCIANRIKIVLPKLIAEDQTGFVAGRYIGDNLRTLYDMMHYLEERQLPGLLVSIDFEKAFDSINWTYMGNVLKAFGFGEDIQKWIKSFYANIKSYVIVNGKVSPSFFVKRGCRQGDPISPYLFILCAEILACKIREDKDIKGIQISDTEFKISQFADDTTFTLEGDRKSYEKLFETLDYFERISGLKLNYEKTCNVWLGRKKNSKEIFLPHINMEWNPEKFKILGLWFTVDLSKMEEINIADKFAEIKRLFKAWLKRSITPLGRVAVLKSLILSKLIYLWILLPNPPDKQIKLLQNMCFEFIWDQKRDKIKRTYSVHNTEQGGLGIPDIKVLMQSLKLSWIRKIYTQSQKWRKILQLVCPDIDLIEVFGPKRYTQKKLNPFWKDTFQAYVNFSRHVELKTGEEVAAEPIFDNEKFKIGNKTFHYINWTTKRVYRVKDLLDNSGRFLRFKPFVEQYKINTIFLNYLSCIKSIQAYINEKNIQFENSDSQKKPKALQIISSVPKGSRKYYDILIEKIEILNIKAFLKWEEKLSIPIDWNKVCMKIRKIKEIKLKWFQIRICHRILVTNTVLKEMGIVNDNACSFCEREKDTINHYLWDCQYSRQFWFELETLLKDKCQNCARVTLNVELILFGTDDQNKTDEVFDFIILIAKYFIYKCRINKIKPNVHRFIKELENNYKIEKHISSLEMKHFDFNVKWCSYMNLLESGN